MTATKLLTAPAALLALEMVTMAVILTHFNQSQGMQRGLMTE